MGDSIREQIRAFVTDNFLFGDASHLPETNVSLIEAGIMDSVGVLELVAFVEQILGIEVPDAEILPANFGSIAGVAGYVASKQDLAAAVRDG